MIFISYRREDSAYALLLYDRLVDEFGPDQVFRDIEGIAAGESFVARLEEKLQSSWALVALIGRGWVRRRPSLAKRDDFVRREVLSALKRGIAIFPLLVGEAKMPSARQLPRVLAGLASVNAIPVTDYRFDSDLNTLVEALAAQVARAAPFEAPMETETLLEQVGRLQLEAVGLIEGGRIAAARRLLGDGWDLLMKLRGRATPGPGFHVQLGYLYKTLGQAFEASGDTAQAGHYMGLAAGAFSRVEREGAGGRISVAELAGALNGLGNVHSYRGRSDEAIAYYRRAVEILPDYAYAWHDLFLEYLTLAGRGRVELVAMREVLSRLRETGARAPGIGPERIARFERELAGLQRVHGQGG